MRTRFLLLFFVLILPALAFGQQRGQRGQVQRPPSKPTPRYPDGHPMLSAPPGELGYWNAETGSIFGKNGNNLPTNLDISEVPFMPWSRALYDVRRRQPSQCHPPPRPHRHLPPCRGVPFEARPEERRRRLRPGAPAPLRRRVAGRRPPVPPADQLGPGFLGHSGGHWEGDTLVIDTVGFNEKFWMT